MKPLGYFKDMVPAGVLFVLTLLAAVSLSRYPDYYVESSVSIGRQAGWFVIPFLLLCCLIVQFRLNWRRMKRDENRPRAVHRCR